ncbi:hypothetical protein BJ912DRAFT_978775 [Pholiota molesta]|nr:hypothetical protein BJ912DRAFT_978775 [Pholiota molesta]
MQSQLVRSPKRPPQLPPREHIEQQPPKKRKLDQVQQPPDPGPSRPPDHIPAPTSSGNPNAHPPSTPTHPIRECNTTGTPSPQKPQLPSRMGLLRTPNKGSSCSPNVPIEQQAQVSKPEQQSPHPPPSVSQPTPDYELTKEELDELGAKPEPQRYNEWMKAMFVYKAEGEIKQTAFWNLYQNTFTPFIKTRPLLDALDGISSIPEVFPQARIMVSEGHPQRYVIQGLDRRKASATKKTHRCEWDRGRCPTQAFASDTDFSDHVLAHLASADSNNWSCLWASCPQPPLPKQALTLHVFGAHLPSMQFSQKHPIQGDVIASPSKNGPSPTEPLSTCLPSQSGPELQQQQVPPPSQPEPRTDALVENLLQTIITRLERMEDAACERYAKLDERLGIMQSAIEVDRKQKQQAEEKERQKAEDEERQKAEAKERQKAEAEERQKAEDEERQKSETETQNLADGQNKIMRYLALLAQPVGEMKRATAEIREVLGIVDATAAPVGQVGKWC